MRARAARSGERWVNAALSASLHSMARQIESSRSRPPILRKAAASLVLLAVAVLVFHLVVHLVLAVFWIVAVIAVIAAVVWAVNELF